MKIIYRVLALIVLLLVGLSLFIVYTINFSFNASYNNFQLKLNPLYKQGGSFVCGLGYDESYLKPMVPDQELYDCLTSYFSQELNGIKKHLPVTSQYIVLKGTRAHQQVLLVVTYNSPGTCLLQDAQATCEEIRLPGADYFVIDITTTVPVLIETGSTER